MDVARRIAENLAQIRERMAAAAKRAGRQAAHVRLLAVTKSVPVEIIRLLLAAGCNEFGESRPQDLWAKASELKDPRVAWHLVGHLQRNKIRRTLPLARLIHSVDSRRLLSALDEEAAALGRPVEVLLEVNISRDATKTGLTPSNLPPLLEYCGALTWVRVHGLMAMASLAGGQAAARRDFATLRELRDRLSANCPQGVSLAELSMGMSGDFEAAIEEGSTIVRVGSALFEGLGG